MTNDIGFAVVSGVHPHVSSLKTSNYQITSDDYLVGIGTLSSIISINLPAAPSKDDQYIIKDVNGSANNYNITIDGYGNNIDGKNSVILYKKYSQITLTYTGSQWSITSLYEGTLTNTPKTSDFSWQNQNSATSVDFGDGIFLFAPTNSGSQNVRYLYQNVPATPYTVTAKFIDVGGFTNATSNHATLFGLAWGDGTKLCTFHINNGDTVFDLNVANWDSVTSFNSNIFAFNDFATINSIQWLRISDDGTNRKCYISSDGINFVQIFSIANNSFLTPTRVGIVLDPFSADQYTSCVSFEIL
jgi:hypothetical protein